MIVSILGLGEQRKKQSLRLVDYVEYVLFIQKKEIALGRI